MIYWCNTFLWYRSQGEQDQDGQDEGDQSDDDAVGAEHPPTEAALGKYHVELAGLCNKILSKQRDHKSRQKRLHRQMKKMREEQKALKSSPQKVQFISLSYTAYAPLLEIFVFQLYYKSLFSKKYVIWWHFK